MVSECIYFVGCRTVEHCHRVVAASSGFSQKQCAMQDVRDASDAAPYPAMSRNCSLADEITSAISPGVCPGAGIAWTPGTISFSDASNSMRGFRGERFFNATIDQQFFHVVIHSRAAQVGLGSPEIPFRF
jgi:hypothetical protein